LVDIQSAARSIIQDWNQGRIPFYTLPPASGIAVESHISSSLVQEWTKEFSVSDLVDTDTLKAIKGQCEVPFRQYAVESCGAVPVDMEMEELPADYMDDEESNSVIVEDEDEDKTDDMDVDVSVLLKNRPEMPEIVFRPTSKKQRAAEEKAGLN
jgi:nuclear GTP-binding protein